MFKQLKPLEPKQDGDLCLEGNQGYFFAAVETVIPMVSSEAAHIAREYAIVFAEGSGQLPLALTGITQGINGYVDSAGRWLARYVPAHVRRYPFMLVDVTQDAGSVERRMMLAVDRDASHLNNAGRGQYLFEQGQPSEVLQTVEKVLVEIHKDGERTKYQTRQIEELGLLQDEPLVIKGRNGNGVQLAGLRSVNRDRFGALSGEELHALHKTGALTLIHAHFVSLSNLTDGHLVNLLDQQSDQPAPLDLDEFFGESGDTLKFDFH